MSQSTIQYCFGDGGFRKMWILIFYTKLLATVYKYIELDITDCE
jgi:hypothetical protein